MKSQDQKERIAQLDQAISQTAANHSALLGAKQEAQLTLAALEKEEMEAALTGPVDACNDAPVESNG